MRTICNDARVRRWMLTGLAGLLLGGHTMAFAIQPSEWQHASEEDFAQGRVDQTVVTNLGDVKLAMGSYIIAEMPEEASVINAMQVIDGVRYIAAGPSGKILRYEDDEITTEAELPGEQVFALAEHNGELLLGISSNESSRLAVLRDGELHTLIELDDVRYIWDMVVEGDTVDLATGTSGALIRVSLDGDESQHETLMETAQNNLLSIGRDGQGRLYVGTDTDGLVYQVSVHDNGDVEQYVLYDAPEPEIGALLVQADGTVYAGTADADEARPGRMEDAEAEEIGRPDEPDEPAEDEAADEEADDEQEIEEELQEELEQEEADLEEELDREVTSQERDALRDEIRSRLARARDTGTLDADVEGTLDRGGQRRAAGSRDRVRQPSGPGRGQSGNAVYRINNEGFVEEVFRESAMVLALAEAADGSLLVATGNEGELYKVNPDRDETTLLVQLDAEQIPAISLEDNGQIVLGTANPAELVALDGQYAAEGSYISEVLDAEQISLWGALNLTVSIPENARVVVETRSGNTSDPDQGPWSAWQEMTVLERDQTRPALHPRSVTIDSPPARFVQYRLTLQGDQTDTPVVSRVSLAYVMPNQRPRINTLTASYPGGGRNNDEDGPAREIEIEWDAEDPNDDELLYKIEYQPAGSQRWVRIADGIDDDSYEWDSRRVPNGWYRVRVTADDRPSNPPDMAMTARRQSEPVLVDNAAPRLEELQTQTGSDWMRISGIARDDFSTIASLAYAVNNEDFVQIAPADLIFDSTEEAFEVTINDLDADHYVVTLRVRDARGNTRYESVLVDIE